MVLYGLSQIRQDMAAEEDARGWGDGTVAKTIL
jgi:hypothetical protein